MDRAPSCWVRCRCNFESSPFRSTARRPYAGVYVPASRVDRENAKVNIVQFWHGEVVGTSHHVLEEGAVFIYELGRYWASSTWVRRGTRMATRRLRVALGKGPSLLNSARDRNICNCFHQARRFIEIKRRPLFISQNNIKREGGG